MSFTNFGTGRSHSFGVRYVELTPRACSSAWTTPHARRSSTGWCRPR